MLLSVSIAAASGAERRLILPIVEGTDIVFSSVSSAPAFLEPMLQRSSRAIEASSGSERCKGCGGTMGTTSAPFAPIPTTLKV